MKTRPEYSDTNKSEKLHPGDILLNRISSNTDFPTFSNSIIELNSKISSREKYSSATDLANTILKDYALTSKLLKMVNSAFYGIPGKKITTVSRAVVLLGYRTVRYTATNLLLFDLMKCDSSVTALKEAFVKAFWCGLISKDVARIMAVKEDEEAFICAMLHNLGRHIVLLYLPDKCDEIINLMSDRNYDEDRASREALGISFEQLGIAVAERWKFPDQIVNSMKRLSTEELRKRNGKLKTLRVLSNFTDDLCYIINTTEERKRKSSQLALMKKYARHLTIAPKQLDRLIEDSLEKVKNHAQLLNINIENSQFLQRLTADEQGIQPVQPERPNSDLESEAAMTFVDSSVGLEAAGMRPDEDEPMNSVEVIMSGIQDMSAAMVGEYEINDIALMALESMYRGMDFNRVVFFAMLKDGKRMEARFGFGPDIEQITRHVSFEVNEDSTFFNLALAKEKDLIVANTADQNMQELVPEWFQQGINAPAFIFLPVFLGKSCLGAFYADRTQAGPPLEPEQFKFVNMIRNQLVLAIKYRR
jgi:HD-like signal output (HDOD) protein